MIFQPQEIRPQASGPMLAISSFSIVRPRRAPLLRPRVLRANMPTPNPDHVFVISFAVTNGTHSAIESSFVQLFIPIHDSNATLDGFYSDLRDAANGTARTTRQNVLVLRHLGVWSRWRWSHQRERLGLGELRRVRQEYDQAERDGFHFHFRFQL